MVIKDGICWPSVEAACAARLDAIHLDMETAPQERLARLQGEAIALRWLLTQADLPPVPKTTPLD